MRLLFESGDYFVQHFRRCGDYSRATSDRANTVVPFINKIFAEEEHCFMQDNDPKRTIIHASNFLESHSIN